VILFINDKPICSTCGRAFPRVQGWTEERYHCGCEASGRVQSVLRECQHLGDPTDSSVTLKHCGCGATTMVFGCALHTLCAPIPQTKKAEIVGRDDVRLCLNCPDNPAATLDGGR